MPRSLRKNHIPASGRHANCKQPDPVLRLVWRACRWWEKCSGERDQNHAGRHFNDGGSVQRAAFRVTEFSKGRGDRRQSMISVGKPRSASRLFKSSCWYFMSSSLLHKQVLYGIALTLLAAIQPACADDEFNLRILSWIRPSKIPLH